MLKNARYLELAQPLEPSIPTWSGGCGYHLETKLDYPVKVQSLKSHAGVGTHIDAPTHFIKDSLHIGQIPLEKLIVPAVVLNVEKQRKPDLFISDTHILEFEKKHGKIPKESLLMAHTGWSYFWKEPEKYRNPDREGRMHFPGFSKEAIELLLEREIVGLGIDTLSPDGSRNGPGADYLVHKALLGEGKYIIENLVHLEKMPAVGAFVIALPPRSMQATEMTARVVGVVSTN